VFAINREGRDFLHVHTTLERDPWGWVNWTQPHLSAASENIHRNYCFLGSEQKKKPTDIDVEEIRKRNRNVP
jgi:hypothetical protein